MADDDLIRRGDARRIALAYATSEGAQKAEKAIAALPAMTVGVKPLEWGEIDFGLWSTGAVLGGEYRIKLTAGKGFQVSRGMLAVPDNLTWFPNLAAAKAAAQADYEARILAALDLTPAPDAATGRVCEDGRTVGEWVDQTVTDMFAAAAEATADMPPRKPAPDAAIREAALRLQKLAYWLDTDAEVLADMDQRDLSDHQHIQAEVNAILTLLPKGGA